MGTHILLIIGPNKKKKKSHYLYLGLEFSFPSSAPPGETVATYVVPIILGFRNMAP